MKSSSGDVTRTIVCRRVCSLSSSSFVSDPGADSVDGSCSLAVSGFCHCSTMGFSLSVSYSVRAKGELNLDEKETWPSL